MSTICACGAWLLVAQSATAEPARGCNSVELGGLDQAAVGDAPLALPSASHWLAPAVFQVLQVQGAAAQADAAPQEDASEPADQAGPLGPFRLGMTVGIGLPNVLNITGLFKITPYFGGGVNFGVIPTIRVSYYGEATLRYQEFDVFGRAYPFGGGFFLGAGIGYESVRGTLANSLDTSSIAAAFPNAQVPNPVVYNSIGSVRSLIVTPQIGYLHTTDIGFSIGIDVGAQIPIAPSQVAFATRLALPPNTPQQLQDQAKTQLVDPNDAKVRSTLKTIGQTPLPTVNLRIGWLF